MITPRRAKSKYPALLGSYSHIALNIARYGISSGNRVDQWLTDGIFLEFSVNTRSTLKWVPKEVFGNPSLIHYVLCVVLSIHCAFCRQYVEGNKGVYQLTLVESKPIKVEKFKEMAEKDKIPKNAK